MLPILLRRAFWISGVALFLLILFLPGFTKLQELKDKNQDLEARITELHRENVLLQEELERVLHDPLYQEEIARDKMGVVRKGEIPVKIIPGKER
ncbi:MAG: septum formation initiator family protein [Candidatus Omnitrophota bacterium]